MVDEKVIEFEEAKTILADDTNPKGVTFLENIDEKRWRIVLPGERFTISLDTLRELAQEHIIAAHPHRKETFLPVRT